MTITELNEYNWHLSYVTANSTQLIEQFRYLISENAKLKKECESWRKVLDSIPEEPRAKLQLLHLAVKHNLTLYGGLDFNVEL